MRPPLAWGLKNRPRTHIRTRYTHLTTTGAGRLYYTRSTGTTERDREGTGRAERTQAARACGPAIAYLPFVSLWKRKYTRIIFSNLRFPWARFPQHSHRLLIPHRSQSSVHSVGRNLDLDSRVSRGSRYSRRNYVSSIASLRRARRRHHLPPLLVADEHTLKEGWR